MQWIDNAIDYFRYLCEQHPDLLHDEAVGLRVFEVRDLEEAFGALRTGIKPKAFAVRLVLPSMSYRGEGNNARKKYQFGLLVAKSHGKRDTLDADVIAAIAAAEKITDEILERMVSDSRNGYALFLYSIDQTDNLAATGEVVLNVFDGTYSGILTMFEFEVFRKMVSTSSDGCDAVGWLDGGLTT